MHHGHDKLPKPNKVQPTTLRDCGTRKTPERLLNGGKETSVADSLLQYLEQDMEDRDMQDAYEGY